MPEDRQNVPDVPVVYSNNVRLAVSFTDFKVFFGESAPPAANLEDKKPTLLHSSAPPIDRVCIVISPDLIPSLADGLAKAAQLYQTQFGPLRKLPQQPAQSAPKPETATKPESKP